MTTATISADCRPETPAERVTASKLANERRYSNLMRAAQDGDGISYATLLREILPLLRRWIQSRLRFLQSSDVEDIVQETLLSLHAARATYDPERPFLPWLSSIAHNRLVDGVRCSSRRAANEILTDELPASAADETSFAADSYGDPEALRRAVQRLPLGQRTAVELLKLHEMSLKEAAQVSGMSIGALKISVHRGIKALRLSLHS